MNPRHRRLLIPGLLVLLLVVVVLASLTRRAEGAPVDAADRVVPSAAVSSIDDPRVTESSGLAVSRRTADLAYTINDSGHAPQVFAVRVSTGRVVGVTTVQGVTWRDTEALAVDGQGRVWVADTGDNGGVRDDVALYAFPEQGAGDHAVRATRYPVRYASGRPDVEALAVDPRTGDKVLVTKGLTGGTLLRLPARLSTDEPNVPRDTGIPAPLMTTDASWSPDGRTLLVRSYIVAVAMDPATGGVRREDPLPEQPQGETVAFDADGRSYLIGSEGRGSELRRVSFTSPRERATARPEPTRRASTERAATTTDDPLVPPGAVGLAVAAALVSGVVVARRVRR